ncbi:MAG: SDR family oxidoreductase [Clostridia bacterium]|nr:SDR family oxidoreductase [Clostridia bacterium]
MVNFDFTGKNVLISGAGGGIGGGIADVFAKAGAKVYVADWLEENAKKKADEINANGGKAVAVKLDVTDLKAIEDTMKMIVDADGGIDNLVTCAGVMYNKPYMMTKPEEMKLTLDVNLVSVDNLCHEALKYMIPKKAGKIVNIQSASSRLGNPNSAHYAASKFGVMGLTQSIALAVAKENINVNGICAGLVVTGLGDQQNSSTITMYMKARNCTREEALEALKTFSPMGRFQTPEDMGNAALFLCSDYAQNITGQSLNVDCGMRLN